MHPLDKHINDAVERLNAKLHEAFKSREPVYFYGFTIPPMTRLPWTVEVEAVAEYDRRFCHALGIRWE